MSECNAYFRQTTPHQRRLLFKIWLETESVIEACRRSHVSRGTFYHWKKRFDQGGLEALKEPEPPGPKRGQRVDPEIEELVVSLKRQHPHWGKQQIADQVAVRLEGRSVSPNTVRRILIEANLWGS